MKYEYMRTTVENIFTPNEDITSPDGNGWELIDTVTAGSRHDCLVFIWRRENNNKN